MSKFDADVWVGKLFCMLELRARGGTLQQALAEHREALWGDWGQALRILSECVCRKLRRPPARSRPQAALECCLPCWWPLPSSIIVAVPHWVPTMQKLCDVLLGGVRQGSMVAEILGARTRFTSRPRPPS